NKAKISESKGDIVADHRAIEEIYGIVDELSQLDPSAMTDAEVSSYLQRANKINTSISRERYDTFMEKMPETVKNLVVKQQRLSAKSTGDVAFLESREYQPDIETMTDMAVQVAMSDPEMRQVLIQMFKDS